MKLKVLSILLLIWHPAAGEDLHIAVASSFRPTLEKIIALYEAGHDRHCLVTAGSTGVLFAQIVNGARFDLLLAADDWRPAELVARGLAREADRTTYARGRLILIGRGDALDGADAAGVAQLIANAQRPVALANPAIAPYGMAARRTLEALDLWSGTRARRVVGQNAAQTLHFFVSGNVDLAFIGLGQWYSGAAADDRSYWLVPQHLYPPLYQEAVVLSRAQQPEAARDFLAFLREPEPAALLQADGYGIDEQP